MRNGIYLYSPSASYNQGGSIVTPTCKGSRISCATTKISCHQEGSVAALTCKGSRVSYVTTKVSCQKLYFSYSTSAAMPASYSVKIS